ncbi:MAG: Gldg family protein [Lachnospiraceae bacterium]|nr:Gldg family protein [Lachnospiraceae bacterium]
MKKLSYRSQNQRKKSLKYGGYATITTLVLLAVLVLINVLFSKLNFTVDLTSEELYTPGEQTLRILDELEDDITIYGLYNTGTEETELNARVIRLVGSYCDLSDHITYKRIDPLTNPTFANAYLQDESQSLDNGTLIMVNETTGKFKTISVTNMYETTTDYTYLTRTVSGFSAEEALTVGLQYVTIQETPVLLQLQGHGESLLGDQFKEYLSYSNFDCEQVNLVLENKSELEATLGTILVVNAPTQDLSETEYETLLNYMESGGRMLFLAEYDTPNLPNFSRLLARFGLSIQTGVMVETDNTHYYQYPSIILPELAKNNDITRYVMNDSNNYVLMTLPAAINISSEVSQHIDITSLVTTSEGAVIKQGENNAVVYEEGDIQGPFNLVVMAQEDVAITDNGVQQAKLCVIGNAKFLSEYATTGNFKLTTIICDELQDTTSGVYITTKSLSEGTIATSDADFFLWGGFFGIVLPLGIVLAGVIVYLRRRHR